MRSAQLPPHFALSSGSCRHWIVSATNQSESYNLFCKRQQQILTGDKFFQPSLSFSLGRFCLDNLLAEDWCALLRECCCLTSPRGSFTYFSPGDIAIINDEEKARAKLCDGTSRAVVNAAFMHIVERTNGDFVPNNMIYHKIQQRYVVGHSYCATEFEEASAAGFSSWLRQLQELRDDDYLDDEKKLAAGKLFSHHKRNSDTEEDPLLQDVHAREMTERNQKLCHGGFLQTVDDEMQQDTVKPIFVFFPHLVNALDSIPYISRHFVVMVNHKPIVPGHLMIVPIRCIGTICELKEEEMSDWGYVVRLTLCVLRRLISSSLSCSGESVCDSTDSVTYNADGGFSVTIQQGTLAGQTVPHLHTHVIPFDPRGNLAGKPEDEELQKGQPIRTGLEMRKETEMLKAHYAFFAGRDLSLY